MKKMKTGMTHSNITISIFEEFKNEKIIGDPKHLVCNDEEKSTDEITNVSYDVVSKIK